MAILLSKVEKRERDEAAYKIAEQADWEAFVASFPHRFAVVLYWWMNRYHSVTYEEEARAFTFGNSIIPSTVRNEYQDWEVKEFIESVERDIRKAEEAKREAQRRAKIKETALAKLTAEEKAILFNTDRPEIE